MRHAALFIVALAAACAAAPSPTEVRTYAPQAPPPASQVQQWAESFAPMRFETSTGILLPYRLLRPRAGGRLPLVIILHGSGAIGSDNKAQLGPFAGAWAQPAVGRVIVAVPQVPTRSADYHQDADGLPASHAGPSFTALAELVDALRSDPAVDAKQVHLVGFSMGGSAALQLALSRPGAFASITAFAPVPPPRALAGTMRGERLTIVHGDADTENPFPASRGWVEALRRSGARPRFIVYHGMGHEVPGDMLASDQWRRTLVGSPSKGASVK